MLSIINNGQQIWLKTIMSMIESVVASCMTMERVFNNFAYTSKFKSVTNPTLLLDEKSIVPSSLDEISLRQVLSCNAI